MPKMRAAAMVLIVAGCESRDERMVSFAERAVETQQRQNEIIGRQSEQVVLESRALAEAAKEVVAADAEARREMIASQRELNRGLQTETAEVHRGRDELEQERRAIAEHRSRDPIIAAAIDAVGTIFACLAPLLLAGYALRQLSRPAAGGDELSDLLLEEWTTDRPALPSAASRPLLSTAVDDRPVA